MPACPMRALPYNLQTSQPTLTLALCVQTWQSQRQSSCAGPQLHLSSCSMLR